MPRKRRAAEEEETEKQQEITDTPNPNEEIITLVTGDNQELKTTRKVAELFDQFKSAINEYDQKTIPVPNCSALLMGKLLEWCTRHCDDDFAALKDDENDEILAKTISSFSWVSEELGWKLPPRRSLPHHLAWDREFVTRNDAHLYSMIIATDFLQCQPMLDFLMTFLADKIKGMSLEKMAEFFGRPHPFANDPEMMKAYEDELQWTFAGSC